MAELRHPWTEVEQLLQADSAAEWERAALLWQQWVMHVEADEHRLRFLSACQRRFVRRMQKALAEAREQLEKLEEFERKVRKTRAMLEP